MAIAPTGAFYKALTFDSTSSRDYGVYITGRAVFNAPQRAVEMIAIPGRNGAFAQDQGRFENIEVTYPAGIFAETEEDFAQAISDFRNFLCSKKGYCRLTDEYNPNEYRMAVYKSGLEVDPARLIAGEFEITFECKPQRWLTDGEMPVEIGTWGDTDTESGSIVEVDNPDGILAIKDLQADIVAVQSGSGTPSPDNVRPINGFTEVKVSRTGKNLLSVIGESWNASGQIATASTCIRSYLVPVQENDVIYASKASAFTGTGSNCMVRRFDTSGAFLSSTTLLAYNATSNSITIGSGIGYIGISFFVDSDTTINDSFMNTYKPMVSLNQSAVYEPIQSDAYTIDLDGTRYGGTLDVTSGVLTVKYGIANFGTGNYVISGEPNSAYANTYVYSNNSLGGLIEPNTPDDVTKAICSALPSISRTQAGAGYSMTGVFQYHSGTTNQFRIAFPRENQYSTSANVMTWLNTLNSNGTPFQVVYPLATPLTVNLTAQEIDMLQGANNVWADTGDVEVEYGNDPNKLLNPTLFESGPLLAIKGYGTIGFNGYEIELENAVLGHILIENSKSNIQISNSGNDINLNLNQLNNGDTITLESADVIWKYRASSGSLLRTWTIDSNTGITGSGAYKLAHVENQLGVEITIPSLTFAKGTSSSYTNTTVLSGTRYDSSTYTAQLVLTIGYAGASTIKVQYAFTYSSAEIITMTGASKLSYGDITGESTQSQLGNPTYIDCELGDAYKIVSDEYVSLNSNVDLGSDLPKLASGNNTVTYDNTITELKITPRWWKV